MHTTEPDRIVPDMVISQENHRYNADGSFDPDASALAQERYENELWMQDNEKHGEERLAMLRKSLDTARRLAPYRELTGALLKLSGVVFVPVGINALKDGSATPKEMAVLGVGAAIGGSFAAANRLLDDRITRNENRALRISKRIRNSGPKFDESLKNH